MTKNETIFICSDCGNESQKWAGKCFFCGQWNTLKEVKNYSSGNNKKIIKDTNTYTFDSIDSKNFNKIKTGMYEFDRVLGEGIVPGSLMLLGGDPGIGKSTILLQVASKISNVLYVSGEESKEQLKLRAKRIDALKNDIKILSEVNINLIIDKILSDKPKLVIIDSIQTVYDDNIPSTFGSVMQVRECALRLQQAAKSSNIPIFIIGHVNKDGNIAGPKTLEHLVDVVLYLEGEKYHSNRILRGIKNRFGATDEVGVFEMCEAGFQEITNPSKIFLKERTSEVSGSVITSVVEGSRPFLVEVQALTTVTNFGYPKRTASGFDLNRLQLLLAVLAKRAGINISNHDVYLNIVGGYKINEPAADVAVCLAIASAYKNTVVSPTLCAFGEVGLAGEIRQVSHLEKRKKEAKRLGFSQFTNEKNINNVIKNIIN